ncbi:MAG: hypothetical protein ACI9YE_003800, partial [Psychroserpens sp.]
MKEYLNDCVICYQRSFKKSFASSLFTINELYNNNKLGMYVINNILIGMYSIDSNYLLSDFCIQEEYQGLGYGKRMLNLINNSPELDIQKLQLKVWLH